MEENNSIPKLTIVMVTWNSMLYLFDSLESLMHQSFRDFSVVIIDNDSKDSTINFVRNYYPTATVLQNFKNNGFSKANNQGIKISKSPYVLIMNPDVILTENYLAMLMKFAEQHPEAGSFGGKLLKLYSQDVDPVEGGGGLHTIIKSDTLDSAGLLIKKNRKVINRGEGQKDQGQYNHAEKIFGLSGACVLYKREALEDVKIKDEYFDNDFFAYKEDIDLAWRLRLYGWESWYLPEALAYHHRRFEKIKGKTLANKISFRRKVSKILRFHSFKNHHLMLLKNEIPRNLLIHFIPFFIREFKILFYSLIFEPFIFKSIAQIFTNFPIMMVKRRVIMAHRKISAKDVRKWFK